MNRVLRLRLVRAPLAVGITLFTMAQIISVGAGALLPDPPPTNPFAQYADLTPGESITTTSELHCEYKYNYPPVQGNLSYCMHIPDHESIEWISVSSRDGIIERVTFGVRLRYGDLVALFGQADRRSVSILLLPALSGMAFMPAARYRARPDSRCSRRSIASCFGWRKVCKC